MTIDGETLTREREKTTATATENQTRMRKQHGLRGNALAARKVYLSSQHLLARRFTKRWIEARVRLGAWSYCTLPRRSSHYLAYLKGELTNQQLGRHSKYVLIGTATGPLTSMVHAPMETGRRNGCRKGGSTSSSASLRMQ